MGMAEGENEDFVKKDVYTDCFVFFCMLFCTSFYSAMADTTLCSNFSPAISRLQTKPTLQLSC